MVNGDHILPSLLDDLRAARHEIHVAMFLFFRDPIGEEIASVLCEKAAQGARVRVLLNIEKTGMGDPFSTGEKEMMKHDPNIDYDPTDVTPLCKRMREAGVEVFDTNIDYDAPVITHDPRLSSLAAQIRGTISIDDLHIDHRKIVVVDGRVAYCGGANIGAQYLFRVPFDPEKDAQVEGDETKAQGSREPWWKWHDSQTRFEGPIVSELNRHFRDRWILDGGSPYEPYSPPGGQSKQRGISLDACRVLTNEPNDRPNEIRELYLQMIDRARGSIFIENPYLYHEAISQALIRAKESRPELEVTLILPAGRWNDNSFAHDAQQHLYEGYLRCGIEVYEYQRHFSHLKMAVFDARWSIHGSTNLNYRSLEDDKDFELVVCIDSAALAGDVLGRVRDVDLKHSRRFTLDDLMGSVEGLRIKTRDPRTLLLLSRRVL